MQKLSLEQHSCSTGGSDAFSTPPNGIIVNGYKQLSKKEKTNYFSCFTKLKSSLS